MRSPLALRRVRETRSDVLSSELRKIREDLILRHPSGEVPEDVTNRNASAPDTGLPEPDLRVDVDSIQKAHDEASLRQVNSEEQ